MSFRNLSVSASLPSVAWILTSLFNKQILTFFTKELWLTMISFEGKIIDYALIMVAVLQKSLD